MTVKKSTVKKSTVKKSKAGRPKKKLAAGQIILIEELAGIGMSIDMIVVRLGICRKSFYNLQEDYPEINTHYKKGKAVAIEQILNVHYQACLDPKNTAERLFYIKSQVGLRETQPIEQAETLQVNVKQIEGAKPGS